MIDTTGHTALRTEISPCRSAAAFDAVGAARTRAPVSIVASTKQLAKQPQLARKRARCLQWVGEQVHARQLLADVICAGGWTETGLWWELVALMSAPDDHQLIRELWLCSPISCHDNQSILRAVARSAAIAGEHHECRTLLRKLIVIESEPSEVDTTKDSRSVRNAIRTLLPSNRRNQQALKNGSEFAARAVACLADLKEAFEQIGMNAFLISGTLLGQVRDGGIIGWDKDIDVGFFKEDCETDLENYFRQHGKFRIGRVDLTSDRLRVIHRNGMWIDVFPHYLENGLRWHDGTATRWWNTPFGLSKIDFLGIEQYVPDNPELYLQENYGDWRVPNRHFDARMDAPNVEVTDPECFVSLLYFSLEKGVRDQKDVLKQRYIGLLRKYGEGTWLDKL